MKDYSFVRSIPKQPGVYRADRTLIAYKQFKCGTIRKVYKVEIPAGAIIVISGRYKFRVSALVFPFDASCLKGPYKGQLGSYRKGYNIPHKLSLNTRKLCAPGLHVCRTKKEAQDL